MRSAFLFALILTAFLSGCDSSSSSFTPKKTKTKIEDCHEPANPYNDGGGHDAGFNWARENGGNCDGHSDSFNEGCAEYYRQLNEYNECVSNSHK